MKIPFIFDIKRGSHEDGPGIRTTVFLKGCNLDCFWCHNPEGKQPQPQVAYFAEKCIGCGTCKNVADPALCPAQARKVYGVQYSPDALFEILARDADYYLATGGGVTFSGGECMLYPDYVAEVAQRCRKAGISVAVDTAGNVPWSSFEKVLPVVDLFLYDIKCLDAQLHKEGTGATNEQILKNLSKLQKAGKQIIIRTPQVPGFQDAEQIEAIGRYCQALGLPWQVLPYHSFGQGKADALLAERCREKAAACD